MLIDENARPGPSQKGWRRIAPAAWLLAAGLWGCSVPVRPVPEPQAPPPDAPPPAVIVVTPPAPPEAPANPPPAVDQPHPADEILAYAETLRALQPAELSLEIARTGEPGDAAPRMLRLAIALGLNRNAANTARAQSLLQRVLAQNTPEAQPLHPLARLLLAQQGEARRVDEQLERQGQQLRDAQRRIDQLNDRLEAVRAIERSLPSRPASAPGNGQRP